MHKPFEHEAFFKEFVLPHGRDQETTLISESFRFELQSSWSNERRQERWQLRKGLHQEFQKLFKLYGYVKSFGYLRNEPRKTTRARAMWVNVILS